ncbi:hypothetical protein E2C01_000291 [Portunus trituberculatus]|uniref:Uncharacterized protein n=1 Tax=Portunus trituberculatus TaxID=210409 RepID=A0A5B7CG91_PORTR|nr:hypothetical protein [Portunus trituberculatus]
MVMGGSVWMLQSSVKAMSSIAMIEPKMQFTVKPCCVRQPWAIKHGCPAINASSTLNVHKVAIGGVVSVVHIREGIVERLGDHDSRARLFTRLLRNVQEISRCVAESVVHNDLIARAVTHVPAFLPHKVILLLEYPSTCTWKQHIIISGFILEVQNN